MKITPDNIELVTNYIHQISHLPGFPTREEGVMATIQSICKIVHHRPIDEIRQEALDRKVKQFGAIILEADENGGKPKQDDLAGLPSDLEWLVSHLFENYEEFPPMVKIRALYESRLPVWREG